MKTVELKSGKDFHFNNENSCKENNSSQIKGFVTWNRSLQMFEIFIDSKLLHSSRDFNMTKFIIKQLNNKFQFQFTEEIDF